MKNEKELKGISKYLSYVLRHHPESIGLILDEKGWADINQLIEKSAARDIGFSREELDLLVANNNKQRFAIDPATNKIRANQGHSISIDADLRPVAPPDILYHGTAVRHLGSILKEGLTKGGRLHVHLSKDRSAAREVGARHGTPVILEINAGKMHEDGFVYYVSDNGVWLTEAVPIRYISHEQ